MKKSVFRRYILVSVLSLITTLIVALSCSGENEQISSVLAQADSLQNIDPGQSLELLLSVDTLGKLSKRERAYRDYLHTSARYKAFYPVDEDTAIFDASDYFRRRGPQELYGRSLMIQGAVLYEQGKVEDALETYKQAESALEGVGSYEDLGLINARLGELYQTSFVNKQASVYRFRRALDFFELSGNDYRVASFSIDYARNILIDSIHIAEELVSKALPVFNKYDDTLMIMYSYETLLHIEDLKNNHLEVINIGNHILSNFIAENDKQIGGEDFFNDLHHELVESYIALGMLREAENELSQVSLTTSLDSMFYYYSKEEIARFRGEWDSAYIYTSKAMIQHDSILRTSYDKKLVDIEQKYDFSLIQEKYQKKRNQNLTLLIVLLIVTMLAITSILVVLNVLHIKEKDKQTYIANILIAKSNLQRDLNLLKEQNRIIQDGLKAKDCKIENQRNGNVELQKIVGGLMGIINEIGYTYSIYKDSSNQTLLVEKLRSQINEALSQIQFQEKAYTVLNIIYPGLLNNIFSSANPSLSQEDRLIISLMCCKFETNTICVFTGLTSSQLNNRKSRISKKLASEDRLSIYLDNKLRDYSH